MYNPIEKLGEKRITEILQEKELSMLKEVKEIFEKNNISFYLACGTALGCVRHKGFIPWDDDIDIYVNGFDYIRIRETFSKEMNCSLQFQDYSTVNNYPYTFPKIVAKDTVLIEKSLESLDYSCGVYIDVFPIFGIDDNKFIRFYKEKKRYLRYALLKAYYHDTFSAGHRKWLKILSRTIINPEKVQKQLETTYRSVCQDTKYLIDPGVFHKDALIQRQIFKETIYMPFEGVEMPMPGGYDIYLNDYYGEYMNLPSERERVSRHKIIRLDIPGVRDLEENGK
ncbi:phosphorylcholine transferase LicD [uncultured Eubacterium sp.]|uniref:LicD family protein n=1 Tax=uncultured Eubacterium sp. TaxID=165185 RepID=UPI0025978271|nr:LicD family protein [uncultured Eubacterium sp.]